MKMFIKLFKMISNEFDRRRVNEEYAAFLASFEDFSSSDSMTSGT